MTTINSRGLKSLKTNKSAFTLVELLVVIGIIALLISILLPSLATARRQAATLKCSAQMREIGNGFLMYAQDNKGYWPPVAFRPAQKSPATYKDLNGNDATWYWFNFVGPYVAKGKHFGSDATAGGAKEEDRAQKSIIWGCPAWDPKGLTDVYQVGYGMNHDPKFMPNYPSANNPSKASDPAHDTTDIEKDVIREDYGSWSSPLKGTWLKMSQWTRTAERALIADNIYWVLEVDSPGDTLGANVPPPAIAPEGSTFPNATYSFWRHGRFPPISNGYFLRTGGKVAFNVLFADGHAATLLTKADGYRAVRQKFPG